MDWNAVGAAVAGLILGAGSIATPWLRAKARHRRAQQPWDGVDRRRRTERLNGHRVVALIEESAAPMPRHWATHVDERAAHKANNVIAPTVLLLSKLEEQVKSTNEAVEDLSRIIQRLIGRLLPGEPVD